ncbi:DUF881 domain-containing protein [Spongisporangium articulatum]|uniref:DUF881 domain-containing protein n=1 Tax=Spongisporangium articulatum TaxID=3362603 RepID=A0ABW8ATQ1_9ACTN
MSPRRLDESMTLLREAMERPLDPGYAQAAERRRQQADDAAPLTGVRRLRMVSGRGLTGVVAVLAGFGLAVSVLAIREPSDAAAKVRTQLAARIEQRNADVRSGEERNAQLRARIAAIQQQALGDRGAQLQAQEKLLSAATGASPVRGPGVEIRVDDAPDSGSVGGTDPRADPAAGGGVVLDVDLQIVVNGLWAAGAQAVAVNGQRLSALSAIRSAGQAILVDFRPTAPPYRIDAVGDPATLQARFAGGSAGPYVQALRDNNGIRVSIDGRDRLELPAAAQVTLRLARPVSTAPTDSAAPTKGSTP